MKIVVAITGASGAIYARLLIQRLEKSAAVDTVYVIYSTNGHKVMQYEQGLEWMAGCQKIKLLDNRDFFVSVASGSSSTDAMVVIPASMGMTARVARGISDDLISRACDVMLKEHRKLIMVVRESPYNLIHLRNMEELTLAGAVILPASPSFYARPDSLEQACESVIDRVLSFLRIEDGQYRWTGE